MRSCGYWGDLSDFPWLLPPPMTKLRRGLNQDGHPSLSVNIRQGQEADMK
ncbi:hypothetical protein GCM10025795_22620 [Verticiella sediminum]